MRTTGWVCLGVLQAALFSQAKLVPGLPKGPLEWGDINILHTSDTHGWLLGHQKNQWPEPNYSGTLGDFASFVGHMKRIAEGKGVDLLLVDSGDLHDGSGLTDGYPEPGINGHEAIKPFLKIPYDVMAIGNHELYQADVSWDVYRNFAPKLPDGRYLSSNVLISSPYHKTPQPIGSLYRRFKTLHGRQITSLGVLFNFKEHNVNTTIQDVSEMVTAPWFQDLMREPTDVFVLAGHMSVVKGDWEIVSGAIKKHHPNTPIAIFGGHTHTRFCRQFDSNTMALESGRFMETVGWMSLKLDGSGGPGVSFSRKYLDANKRTYMYHTNTTEQTFNSVNGLEIDMFTKKLYSHWNLGRIHGCVSENYYVDRYNWSHPQNVQTFYTHKVVPEVLIKGWNRANHSYVFIANTGMLRFDIYRGPFTWNDQLTVLPFKEGYRYIEVPWSIAREVKRKMYEYPKDHLDAASILANEFGPGIQDGQNAQHPLSLPDSDLTPGYVTDDGCGGNGDDTEHAKIPIIANPEYYSNDPDYSFPDNHTVDVIVPDFLKARMIEAVNKLSSSRVYTLDDVHAYGTVPSKKIFAKYFENFPPGANGCVDD